MTGSWRTLATCPRSSASFPTLRRWVKVYVEYSFTRYSTRIIHRSTVPVVAGHVFWISPLSRCHLYWHWCCCCISTDPLRWTSWSWEGVDKVMIPLSISTGRCRVGIMWRTCSVCTASLSFILPLTEISNLNLWYSCMQRILVCPGIRYNYTTSHRTHLRRCTD